MIKENCIHFTWEWVLDLEPSKILSKTENGAKSKFWMKDICDIEVEECEKTGECNCAEESFKEDGECPRDCPTFEEVLV